MPNTQNLIMLGCTGQSVSPETYGGPYRYVLIRRYAIPFILLALYKAKNTQWHEEDLKKKNYTSELYLFRMKGFASRIPKMFCMKS